MGHKVSPISLRLGIVKEEQAKWFAEKNYPQLLKNDLIIYQFIDSFYKDAGVSRVEIERKSLEQTIVTIYTSRPGVVIGRGGERIEQVSKELEKKINNRIDINVLEVREPRLDACLVAKEVAQQIEGRASISRVARRAITRAMEAGALGVKITCSGRLGGAEIARSQTFREGRLPLHTLRADIDYGFAEAHTILGRIGVKVWIYKGEVTREMKEHVTAEQG